MSKKERARLAAEQAEQARIQAELEEKRKAEEERQRLMEEKKAALEKEQKETAEQNFRNEQLVASMHVVNAIQEKNLDDTLKEKAQWQWEEYLNCDRMPNPYMCAELTRYLHLWDKEIEATTLDAATKRTKEVLPIINNLTRLIDDTVGVSEEQIKNWKWIRRLFCEYQQKNLETAAYNTLRAITVHLHRINLTTADFLREEEDFVMFMWLKIPLPRSIPNPRKQASPRLNLNIPSMKMEVLFPVNWECKEMAIKAMYEKYDHLSDMCSTYERPSTPEQVKADMLGAAQQEWYARLYYKYEKYCRDHEDFQPTEEVNKEKGIIPKVPYQKLIPSPYEYVVAEEEKMYQSLYKNLKTDLDEHTINLQRYLIIGGIYHINIFQQPPQPQLRVGLNNLLITRRHVMWLDIPQICFWDKEKLAWSTQDVHDLKHIEDKGFMTFRAGRFGCFTFAMNRYINFPFQAWELKPETDGTVSLQLTAAILMIDFNVKADLICVSQFQNVPNNALQEIAGVYYKLPQLIRIMQEGGVDVFPAFDAFSYVEGACPKHWPMEKHAYYVMGQMSRCFNFAWSRWNMAAGRRSIVMQMREYRLDKAKQVLHSMALITPLQTALVDCTEVSPAFNTEPAEGMHFYADLYHLMKGITNLQTRAKIQNTPHRLVDTVASLLIATRITSFS